MTTEKEQLKAEIAERDARIAEQLREITQLRRELGIVQEVANSALKAQQPSACVIGGTGISSSMRGALAEAGQQPASGGTYSSDPLACSGCAAGCFRCRSSAGVEDERAAFEQEFPRSHHAPAVYWCEERQRYVGHGDAFENNGPAYQHKFENWKKARARLDQPTASAGVVVGALVSALEGIVHDERVPNEVSQDYAALLIEARRLNPCRAQSVPDDEELKLLRAFYKCCASITDQLADSPKSALARLVEAVKDAAPSAKKESGDE